MKSHVDSPFLDPGELTTPVSPFVEKSQWVLPWMYEQSFNQGLNFKICVEEAVSLSKER